jgi:hypothetical protein
MPTDTPCPLSAMKTLFKVIFSPILIVWWLAKLIVRIVTIPLVILWRTLRFVAPELTRPLDGLANALGQIFSLR